MNDNDPNGDKRKALIDESMAYLTDGGLGEVIGMTDVAIRMGQPKVQMDTHMAMALCLMAATATKRLD